ncbi:MAG TPA: CocE/NonD family hydrolase [Ignavibacteriaceae bacterium]|nr:CocE/NonD family hydrolase [Ignavibacteriaceae bacterium]
MNPYFSRFFLFIILSLICLTQLSPLLAQENKFLEENYIKKEYRIPMRDGVKLFTAVYSPKDTSVKYPIIIWRTPYSVGPYGEDKYVVYRRETWQHFIDEGYIIVFQDVRGRFMSEGDFVNMRPYIPDKKSNKDVDESSDAYDTVDWLVKNIPNNNGKVGFWGISYPGFYAAMAGIDAHPAVKAISPQAPIADWFGNDDWHHNGALGLAEGVPFMSVFGVVREGLVQEWPEDFKFGTMDGYNYYLNLGPLPNVNKKYFHHKIPFWDSLMVHGTYDYFWKARNTLPHFNNIKPAVLVVGGWFDAENLYGALHTYESIEEKNPENKNYFVMGPWFHGGWVRTDGSSLGDIKFGSKTGNFYVKNIELPFFNYYLKGKGELNIPKVYAFQTGSNKWMKYDSWPPENTKAVNLYLNDNHSLSFNQPPTTHNQQPDTFDEYISDPFKPVPYTKKIVTSYPKDYMVEDQRFAARRPDVLNYGTNILDSDIAASGNVTADLFVSTSGTDADWVVKLIDVFPADSDSSAGIIYSEYEMMVRGNIMRGKFRESFENPKPFIPGEITNIKFDLQDINHTFKKGHRIMVQIQNSWFPIYDLNPQIFVDIYNADEKDFQKATQRVYFSRQYPSRIILNEKK